MDQPVIRAVPFELADIVDRPPLKRIDDVGAATQRHAVAEFARRTAEDFLKQARQLESMHAVQWLANAEPAVFQQFVNEFERLYGVFVGNAEAITVSPPRRRRRRRTSGQVWGITLEVLKDNDGWVVLSQEGARVGSPAYAVKKDAVEIARKVARDSRGTLRIYNSGGKVVEQRSYQPTTAGAATRETV
jgi:hypothetical protein